MKKEKLIAGILTLLFVASLITVGIVSKSNVSLKSGLDKEKLRSEAMLSEKLNLDKEIEKYRSEINLLKGRNTQLDQILADANQKLEQKQKTIASLNKENASVRDIKKQLAEVQQIRLDLEKQVARLQENNQNLLAENENLQNTILTLQVKNAEMAQVLENIKNTSADNYQVIATKGKKKEKLTVNASKTKRISVNFEIPQNFTDNVSFKITTPEGKIISGEDKSLTWAFSSDEKILTASLDGGFGDIEVTRTVAMTYSPKEKLKTGTYQIEIMNKKERIGSCRVKLK